MFRRIRSRPLRFTRFGWFYIFFSLAVGAAAINTSNNLLYLMLGLLLGFILISGVLSDSCLWGLHVDLTPAGDFYAEQPASWDLVVRTRWFPGIVVWVEAFWGSGDVSRILFYWIPRYGSRSQRVSLTPKRRGLLRLERLRIFTRFPFGLFEKSHPIPSHQSGVVFPRLKVLPLDVLRAGGMNFSDQPAERKGPGAAPFDLREYRMGDSSKRIHWKSSAKRGQWMVTEMEEESALSRQVWVSGWPADPESFISFVASLIYTLHRQGLRVGLRTPGAEFEAEASRTHLKKILTYLALVDPAQEQSRVSSAGAERTRWIDALALWTQQP